jgi:hypothetical protein
MASHMAARKNTAICAIRAGKPQALALRVPTAHMAPTNITDMRSALNTNSSRLASCTARISASRVENR